MNRVSRAEVSKCSGVERIRYKHNLSVAPHRTALRRCGAAPHLVRAVNSAALLLFVVGLVWFMDGLLVLLGSGWLDRAEPGDRKPVRGGSERVVPIQTLDITMPAPTVQSC